MLMRHMDVAQDNRPLINTQGSAAMAPVDNFRITLSGDVHKEDPRAKAHDGTIELDTTGAFCYKSACDASR